MMTAPWFDDPNTFSAIFGGVVGGVGGALGGIFGAISGFLARRGQGKGFVIGGFSLFLLFGLVSLGAGVTALVQDQPYGICYPFLLVGFIFTLGGGIAVPVLLRQFAKAEKRKLEAEELRRS